MTHFALLTTLSKKCKICGSEVIVGPPPEPLPETNSKQALLGAVGSATGVPAGFGRKSSLLVGALLVFCRQTERGATASMGSTKGLLVGLQGSF